MSNITVLTPAYNRGKLLEKLYESLCAQDCKDFEWLIVDDGSTDDTSERVEQMKQTADFPISYHKKENGGKHTALNYAYQFIKAPLTFIGWNWVLQYEKNYKEGDRIILLTKKFNEKDTRRGLKEFNIQHVELVIVDVPNALNWLLKLHLMKYVR